MFWGRFNTKMSRSFSEPVARTKGRIAWKDPEKRGVNSTTGISRETISFNRISN